MTAAEITQAIGPLLEQLGELGFRVTDSRYEPNSFGNFYVDCKGRKVAFRIVRDRSQYFLDGNVEDNKKRGVFRAYNSVTEFSAATLQYAKSVA